MGQSRVTVYSGVAEKLGQPDLKPFQPTNTEAGRSVPISIFPPPSLDDPASSIGVQIFLQFPP